MNRPENNDPLRELLTDAVADVEPDDALGSIRNRTKVTPMSARRPWLLGAGGAVVATAATITAIAFAGNLGNDDSADPGPATSPSGQVNLPSGTRGTTDAPDDSEEIETGGDRAGADPGAVPVYYAGDTARGLGLYREFLSGDDPSQPVLAALTHAVEGDPLDPDYRSLWPDGADINEVGVGAKVLTVNIDGVPADRPAGMSEREAELAVQQVVYTAQAAHGRGRIPVMLEINHKGPSTTVLGVDTSEWLPNAPVTETLSLMNITAPREGVEVSGGFTATGVNNGFEAWVGWQVLDAEGKVVTDGFGMAKGSSQVNRLFPWRVEVDLGGIAPGTYTFRAYNDDPTGGAEGPGVDEDTRTIIVK